jgi:hypothetical protein
MTLSPLHYQEKLMLRFVEPPDALFTRLINDALDLSIDSIAIGYNYTDWLDDLTLKLFGSDVSIVTNELKKLRDAHNSSKLFMPTDYHFRLLDRVIAWYCILYNDFSPEEKYPAEEEGYVVDTFDFDEIAETFFWDNDYELIDTLLRRKSSPAEPEVLSSFGLTDSGLAMIQGKVPDTMDLKLEQYDDDEIGDAAVDEPGIGDKPGIEKEHGFFYNADNDDEFCDDGTIRWFTTVSFRQEAASDKENNPFF